MKLTIYRNAGGVRQVSAVGYHKLLNSRCFKNEYRRSLGFVYHANKNAWMTRNVFILWLEAFVEQVAGRKVIHVLDNRSALIKEEL